LSEPVHHARQAKISENPKPSDDFENEFSVARMLVSLANSVHIEHQDIEDINIAPEVTKPTSESYPTCKHTKESSTQVYILYFYGAYSVRHVLNCTSSSIFNRLIFLWLTLSVTLIKC
jgi:hypothetical protein